MKQQQSNSHTMMTLLMSRVDAVDELPLELQIFYRDAADILVHNMMRRHDAIWGTELARDPARLHRQEQWSMAGVPWNLADEGHRFKLFTMLGIKEPLGIENNETS